MKTDYGTLSQTINGLKEEGYTLDFNIQDDLLVCHTNNTQLSPDDFEIDGVFRFEGESNPDDEAVLYAISSTKDDIKGTLVNGYGISADAASNDLIKKLSTHS
ncbi:phosphoribosylpyrophosphate synthetase [Mucilaginibacter lutimaris]|uniref:Phosphoribosylpyrophosphate synthetase n=1 Tax=Mucilaginibacter lutimaris TaxID=931629 RepID=A0ABW2ZKL2_9SPHI